MRGQYTKSPRHLCALSRAFAATAILASLIGGARDADACRAPAPALMATTQDWLDDLIAYLQDLYERLGGDASTASAATPEELVTLTMNRYDWYGLPPGLSPYDADQIASIVASAYSLVQTPSTGLSSASLVTLDSLLESVWSQLGLDPGDLYP